MRPDHDDTLTRESTRVVWRPGWLHLAGALWRDIRFARRSLLPRQGPAFTVVVTLALASAPTPRSSASSARCSSVLSSTATKDRLIYIRQSAPGLRAENTTFSMPEIHDLQSRATTVNTFGDFSTIDSR